MYELVFYLDLGLGADKGVVLASVPYENESTPYHLFSDTAQKVEESVQYDFAALLDTTGAPFVFIAHTENEGWSLHKLSDWAEDKPSNQIPSYTINPRDCRNFAVVLDAIFLMLWWRAGVNIID